MNSPRGNQDLRRAMILLAALSAPPAMPGPLDTNQGFEKAISREIDRNQAALSALPASPLGEGEIPRLKGQLESCRALMRSGHAAAALETLSSAIPGIAGLRRASTGWDDSGKGTGKGIDALTREWEEVGRALKVERPKFPAEPPAKESAFIRALAEQSMGQIDEHYAVAVDYARFSGASPGAYYLGRAEGQLAFALFLSGLPGESAKAPLVLPSLAAPIAALEDDIVAAYAKPGSTKEHTNFIIANSSLKLARELDQKGGRLGALLTLMRGRMALGLATLAPPGRGQEEVLAASLDAIAERLSASPVDQTIGSALVEKARLALEAGRGGGEDADHERLRAASLVNEVLPRYLGLANLDGPEEGSKK